MRLCVSAAAVCVGVPQAFAPHCNSPGAVFSQPPGSALWAADAQSKDESEGTVSGSAREAASDFHSDRLQSVQMSVMMYAIHRFDSRARESMLYQILPTPYCMCMHQRCSESAVQTNWLAGTSSSLARSRANISPPPLFTHFASCPLLGTTDFFFLNFA
jgi:hypothetical protein